MRARPAPRADRCASDLFPLLFVERVVSLCFTTIASTARCIVPIGFPAASAQATEEEINDISQQILSMYAEKNGQTGGFAGPLNAASLSLVRRRRLSIVCGYRHSIRIPSILAAGTACASVSPSPCAPREGCTGGCPGGRASGGGGDDDNNGHGQGLLWVYSHGVAARTARIPSPLHATFLALPSPPASAPPSPRACVLAPMAVGCAGAGVRIPQQRKVRRPAT